LLLAQQVCDYRLLDSLLNHVGCSRPGPANHFDPPQDLIILRCRRRRCCRARALISRFLGILLRRGFLTQCYSGLSADSRGGARQYQTHCSSDLDVHRLAPSVAE
jgi:hypothetical protein